MISKIEKIPYICQSFGKSTNAVFGVKLFLVFYIFFYFLHQKFLPAQTAYNQLNQEQLKKMCKLSVHWQESNLCCHSGVTTVNTHYPRLFLSSTSVAQWHCKRVGSIFS